MFKRILPEVHDDESHFWRGGQEGQLTLLQCQACDYYIHPASPVCPTCLSRDIIPVAVSGRGRVASYTVNYQAWHPDLEVPYIIVIVELDEQEGLRMTSNLVNCAIESVKIGLAVKVRFEQHDDIYLPLFEPDTFHDA